MTRRGFTSVTIPIVYYNKLVSLSDKLDTTVGQTVAVLYELYLSLASNPQLSEYVKMKLAQTTKKVKKKWKRVIEESKEYE